MLVGVKSRMTSTSFELRPIVIRSLLATATEKVERKWATQAGEIQTRVDTVCPGGKGRCIFMFELLLRLFPCGVYLASIVEEPESNWSALVVVLCQRDDGMSGQGGGAGAKLLKILFWVSYCNILFNTKTRERS